MNPTRLARVQAQARAAAQATPSPAEVATTTRALIAKREPIRRQGRFRGWAVMVHPSPYSPGKLAIYARRGQCEHSAEVTNDDGADAWMRALPTPLDGGVTDGGNPWAWEAWASPLTPGAVFVNAWRVGCQGLAEEVADLAAALRWVAGLTP